MTTNNDYPRMLYRPGKGAGEMVWEQRVDTNTVNSAEEESSATRQGWLRDPVLACEKAKIKKKRELRFGWFVSHWQYWLNTLLVLAALMVSIATYYKTP